MPRNHYLVICTHNVNICMKTCQIPSRRTFLSLKIARSQCQQTLPSSCVQHTKTSGACMHQTDSSRILGQKMIFWTKYTAGLQRGKWWIVWLQASSGYAYVRKIKVARLNNCIEKTQQYFTFYMEIVWNYLVLCDGNGSPHLCDQVSSVILNE